MQIYCNPTSSQCCCRICDFQWLHTAVYPLPRKESESWPERSNGWPHWSGRFPGLSSLGPRSTSFPEFEATWDSGPAFAASWGHPSSSRRIGRASCRPRCSHGRTFEKIVIVRIQNDIEEYRTKSIDSSYFSEESQYPNLTCHRHVYS